MHDPATPAVKPPHPGPRRSAAAARSTVWRNAVAIGPSPLRRDARCNGADRPGQSDTARNVTPGIATRRIDAGTIDTPSPAATRLSVEGSRGASCATTGANPAPRHAATMASYSPGPDGRR